MMVLRVILFLLTTRLLSWLFGLDEMFVRGKSMARFGSGLVLFALFLIVGLVCWVHTEHRRGLHRLRGPLGRIEVQFDS
jgi:hypothetical protein